MIPMKMTTVHETQQFRHLPGMTGGFTLVGDSGQAAALSHKVKCCSNAMSPNPPSWEVNMTIVTRSALPASSLTCSLTTQA